MKLLQELTLILNESRTPTNWTVLNVVKDILGQEHISIDPKNIRDDQYLVRKIGAWDGEEPGFLPHTVGKLEDWMAELGMKATRIQGALALPDLNSRDAVDIAITAHEASHAWLAVKSKGTVYKNEKMVNQMATKWLKKNLSGLQLHTALESILKSKISYGHN